MEIRVRSAAKAALITLMLMLLPVMPAAGETSDVQTIRDHLNFPECPGTPNCVSSLAEDSSRRVEPFPVMGEPSGSMERLADIIESSPRTTLISSSAGRIEARYRSLLGFVDDVLFVMGPEEKVIHVRSASRKGYWDLGVNRRRVERIRKEYLTIREQDSAD